MLNPTQNPLRVPITDNTSLGEAVAHPRAQTTLLTCHHRKTRVLLLLAAFTPGRRAPLPVNPSPHTQPHTPATPHAVYPEQHAMQTPGAQNAEVTKRSKRRACNTWSSYYRHVAWLHFLCPARSLSLSLSLPIPLSPDPQSKHTLTLRSGCATSGRTHITGRIRWRNRMLPTRQPQQLLQGWFRQEQRAPCFPLPSCSLSSGFCFVRVSSVFFFSFFSRFARGPISVRGQTKPP